MCEIFGVTCSSVVAITIEFILKLRFPTGVSKICTCQSLSLHKVRKDILDIYEDIEIYDSIFLETRGLMKTPISSKLRGQFSILA